MPKIKRDLATLKETDTWSLILFTLYKIKDVPEFSALSELIYVLDKDSLLKLCEFFGGLTITIPTIEELENLVKALVLYQNTVIDKMDYDEAVKLIDDSENMRLIKSAYIKICKVLDEYNFTTREVADDN